MQINIYYNYIKQFNSIRNEPSRRCSIGEVGRTKDVEEDEEETATRPIITVALIQFETHGIS